VVVSVFPILAPDLFGGFISQEETMAEISMRDEPGTQREYETIFILRPDTNQEGITHVNSKVRQVIESMGGKTLKLDNWGKRKLAYEIKKQLKGIYMYWQFLATAGVVEEIERNLRMLDSVIRYYTVKVDEDVDPNVRPSTVDDEVFAKAASTIPDEEELVTGAVASRFRDEDEEDDEFDPDLEEAALASDKVEE
jgi:small subunit ribosomal protein S6